MGARYEHELTNQGCILTNAAIFTAGKKTVFVGKLI